MSIMQQITKLLGNSSRHFSLKSKSEDGLIEVLQNTNPDKGQPLEPEFEDFEMRDKLLEMIEQIMKNKGEEFQLELKFKRSIVTTQLRNGIVAIQFISPDRELVREEQMQGEITAWFNGKKPFPLKQWLIENVLVEEDVIELEKSLIYLV